MSKKKKKNKAKPRKCRNTDCGIIYTPGSDKSAFHHPKCKDAFNRARRNTRDALFLAILAGMKNNYQILMLYKNNTVVTMQELLNLGFDFLLLLREDEDAKGGYYNFGNILLRWNSHDDVDFKIERV